MAKRSAAYYQGDNGKNVKSKQNKRRNRHNAVRNTLATHIRVTTTMNTEDDHVIDIRTCTTPTEKQSTIYNKLHIKHTPLERKHIKSSTKTQRCSAEN